MKAPPPIVHYLPDDKFANFFVELIRALDGERHHFAVDPAGAGGSLLHTKLCNVSAVLDPSKPVVPQLADVIQSSKTLVLHFMNPRAQQLALASPTGVTVFWSGWGADYYHLLPGGQRGLYCSRTLRLVDTLADRQKGSPLSQLRRLALRSGAAPVVSALRQRKWRHILARVDLFSSPLPPEYKILRDALGRRFSAQYCQINYGSIEDSFGPESSSTRAESNKVLLGNSADPVGNHLDAAEGIPYQMRSALTLVVPLSYGNAEYAELLLGELLQLGFAKVEAMRQFLPLKDYLASTGTCSVAIFNARRQHALGNIGASLCRGTRVFLHAANPALSFLRSLGATVDSCDCLAAEIRTPPNETRKARETANRTALERFWGRKSVERNAIEFIETVS